MQCGRRTVVRKAQAQTLSWVYPAGNCPTVRLPPPFPFMSCLSHIVLPLQCQWSFWGVMEDSSSAWVFCYKRWFSDFAGFSVQSWGGEGTGVHLWEDVPETNMGHLVLSPHWCPSTQSEQIHFTLLPYVPVLRQNIFFHCDDQSRLMYSSMISMQDSKKDSKNLFLHSYHAQ